MDELNETQILLITASVLVLVAIGSVIAAWRGHRKAKQLQSQLTDLKRQQDDKK